MSRGSKIEWATLGLERGASWNPIIAVRKDNGQRGWACVRVAEGCKNCYAATLNMRQRGIGTGLDYTLPNLDNVDIEVVRTGKGDSDILAPRRWRKPTGIFVCSMSDLFGEFVDDNAIYDVFRTMDTCFNHHFAVLTKRIERASEWIPMWYEHPEDAEETHSPIPRNIWVGFSAGTQKSVNEALPYMKRLRQVFPDAILWVSNEPALEPIDWTGYEGVLSWLVTGGESGTNARPMPEDAPYRDRDWCDRNGVPFFFKQGSQANWPDFKNFDSFPDDLKIRQFPV